MEPSESMVTCLAHFVESGERIVDECRADVFEDLFEDTVVGKFNDLVANYHHFRFDVDRRLR
jgi:hypothetical protein